MRYAIAFLLLSSPLLAQDEPPPDDGLPKAVVRSPAEVDPGELLPFDATDSVGEHFLWMVDFTGGTPIPNTKEERIRDAIKLLETEQYTVIAPSESKADDYRIDSGGKILYAASKPGRRYSVTFAVSNAKGIAGTIARARVNELPGTPPPPPPDDDDDDDPPPPPPPGGPDLDLSQEAAEWIKLVPQNVRGEVFTHPISQDTMTRQQAVGRTFREVGGVAGELGSFETIEMMLSISLGAAYMQNEAAWRPFTDKANAALESLIAQRVTFAQYGQALQSIGRALE